MPDTKGMYRGTEHMIRTFFIFICLLAIFVTPGFVTNLSAESVYIVANADTGTEVPIGTVLAMPYEYCPLGTLEADGRRVSRTEYAELFAYLGVRYGAGDGSTTFNVPDYRGRFMRGANGGAAGLDLDYASRDPRADGADTDLPGSIQGDQFKTHYHIYQDMVPEIGWDGDYGVIEGSAIGINGTTHRYDHERKTDPIGGSETRPKNINVLYCIKYK